MGKKKDKKKQNKQSDIDVSFVDYFLQNELSEVDSHLKSTVAKEIRDRIRNGATVDDISEYKSSTLKSVLSFFRVSGRSTLTYKEDMAKRLVEVFGEGEDKHGKKSLKKKEEERRRQEMDNLVIKRIKKDEKKRKR